MIERFMYMGYSENQPTILENNEIICVTVKRYKDRWFLYYETNGSNVTPEHVVKCDMKTYDINGRQWVRLPKIFAYLEPSSDAQWERHHEIEGEILVNYLKIDKIASYIYYHYVFEHDNPYNVSKHMSIYIHEDMIVMYREKNDEKITWADIEGKNHIVRFPNWAELMQEHFSDRWINVEEV